MAAFAATFTLSAATTLRRNREEGKLAAKALDGARGPRPTPMTPGSLLPGTHLLLNADVMPSIRGPGAGGSPLPG